MIFANYSNYSSIFFGSPIQLCSFNVAQAIGVVTAQQDYYFQSTCILVELEHFWQTILNLAEYLPGEEQDICSYEAVVLHSDHISNLY